MLNETLFYKVKNPVVCIFLLVFVFCSMFSLSAYDRQRYFPNEKKVLIGAEYGYPPYSIMNEAGEADGFSVQLITSSLSAMGYDTEFIMGPWSEVKQYPLNGTVQALPLVGRTPEREEIYDFTFPYLTMHGTILVHEDTQDIFGLDDLSGKRIVVMAGDNAEEFVFRINLDAEIISTNTFEEALIGLSDGIYDAVILQKLLAYQLMNQLEIDNLKTTGPPLTDFSQSFCFAVSKGDEELLSLLNEGLSLVIADGTFRKLYSEWFGPIEAVARSLDRILVGGDFDYPPYEFLDANGQPTGFNVELTKAIAAQMGLSVEILLAPWTETYTDFGSGRIDIIQGLFYSVDRDESINFSQPHSVVNHVIVTREGSSYNTLEELDGLEILVMKDDIMYDKAIKYGYEDHLITAESLKEVLRLLSEGTADCALVAQIPANFWIEKNELDNLAVGSLSILSPDYSYAALYNNDDLLMLFSEGLAAIKSSGVYREIYNRWLGVYEEHEGDFWEVFKKLLFVIIPVLMLGIGSLLWSWSLKRQVGKSTRELRDQKDLLERVATTSPVGIVVSGVDGVMNFSNPTAKRLLEIPLESSGVLVFNDPGWKIVNIDNQPIPVEERSFSKVVRQKKSNFGTLYWITGHEGTRKLISVNSSPLFDDTGSVTGVVSVLSDITDQHKAQVSLQNEKEQLAVTLQSITDGVITVSVEGVILLMNSVAEKLTGWLQAQAAGQLFETVYVTESQSNAKNRKNITTKVLLSGNDIEVVSQNLLISQNGIKRSVSERGAPIKDKHGKVIGVVVVFHDLTDEQKLLDYIQRSAKLDSLGLLAGGIAHDFNNLLGGLFGYIEMAKSVGGDEEQVTLYLDESLKAFERAKDLTMQLLTFSKGGAPVRAIGDLGALIQKSSTFSLSGSKSSCIYDIPKSLWLCEFDENQIGQVLDNLIINAQQAMPDGGKITILACNTIIDTNQQGVLEAGEYIHISISDAGEGISPEHIKQIFDPFFTTKKKGHGLGLATCYSIIKKHNGLIDVDSKLGVGTVFNIYLPRSTAVEVDSGTDVRKGLDHHGNGLVVVMDDEKIIRDVVGSMVKSMGYKILEAQDGEGVLELCRTFHDKNNLVKAALFDLTIPGGMGGKDAVLQCRKKYPDMPIFASSGYSADPIMAEPEKYGFTASISKPYRLQDLKELFNKYVENKQIP